MPNVFGFGAKEDGIADDAEALLHTLDSGDGVLRLFPASISILASRPVCQPFFGIRHIE